MEAVAPAFRSYSVPIRNPPTFADPYADFGAPFPWIERQLPARVSASLAYIGNHSLTIMATTEGNPAVYAPSATTGNVDSRRIYQGAVRRDPLAPDRWPVGNAAIRAIRSTSD